ncbi:hypothetical protein RJ639_020808 [Escallonia herrerae]|uniref:Retrotransposon Copia-like N-terminal domain-containing protein n=1 Tax=Escallonia herrerae TaxID=1293975 RepID=A0AA89AH42_9ASTE|nr:hypothetical protein RJ639_020808 [Escallonia herrerae]
MPLVTQLLTSDNYPTWSRAVIMALEAKNKLGFVDNTIKKPGDSADLPFWIRCNSMVTSWIIHSTVPAIANSILWTTNAHEVWVDLLDRFSQKNAPRIFEIRRAISNNVQNKDSMSQYYTTLKAYLDELSSYRTPPNCTCGAMKTHTELLDSDALMDFLQGLNESYASVQSQILLMDPLPSMAKAYSLILQEERQRSLHDSGPILHAPAAMATTHKEERHRTFHDSHPTLAAAQRPLFSPSRSNSRHDNNRPHYHCNYCNIDSHSDSRYFKQHGYHPRTNDNTTNRGGRNTHQQTPRAPAPRGSPFGHSFWSNAVARDDNSTHISPSLTPDQIQ